MYARLHLFFISLIPPIVVLVVHLVRYHFRPDLAVLDIVAHFCGGFAIAWMGYIFFSGLGRLGSISKETPLWLVEYAILGTVMLAGVIWEFYEWTSDHYFGAHMQFGLTDTMGDLLMDLSGGILFLLVTISVRAWVSKNRRGQPLLKAR